MAKILGNGNLSNFNVKDMLTGVSTSTGVAPVLKSAIVSELIKDGVVSTSSTFSSSKVRTLLNVY